MWTLMIVPSHEQINRIVDTMHSYLRFYDFIRAYSTASLPVPNWEHYKMFLAIYKVITRLAHGFWIWDLSHSMLVSRSKLFDPYGRNFHRFGYFICGESFAFLFYYPFHLCQVCTLRVCTVCQYVSTALHVLILIIIISCRSEDHTHSSTRR